MEMTKDENFKLLKIQTIVLKVNLHCDGCKREVKKVLRRIEGVYTVAIDAELQKVTVSGDVDSVTLMKKLAKSGKPAQLWNQKVNRSMNHQGHKPNKKSQEKQSQPIKDAPAKNNVSNHKNKPQAAQPIMQGFRPFKNQQSKFDSFSSDDEFSEGEEDDEDDIGFRGDNSNQITPAVCTKKNGKNNGRMMTNLNAAEVKGMNCTSNSKMVSNPYMNSGMMNTAGSLRTLNKEFLEPNSGGFGAINTRQWQGNIHGSHGHPSSVPSRSIYSAENNLTMNESRQQQPLLMYNSPVQCPSYIVYYPSYSSSSNHQPEGHGDHNYSDEDISSCAIM